MNLFADMMVSIEINDRTLLVAPDTFTAYCRTQDEAEGHNDGNGDEAIVKRVALAFSRIPRPTLVMALKPSQARTLKGLLAISCSVRSEGHRLSVFNNWAVLPYYKNGSFLLHDLDSDAVLASNARMIKSQYARVNEKAANTGFFDRLQQFLAWFQSRPTMKTNAASFDPYRSIKSERG